MVIEDKINYWIKTIDEDLGTIDAEHAKKTTKLLSTYEGFGYKEFEDKGIVVYLIDKNLCGTKVLIEVLIYVRKEHRGNVRLITSMIKHLEAVAEENSCKQVQIGGNIGYRDDKFLYLLSRFGYKTDTVRKEI